MNPDKIAIKGIRQGLLVTLGEGDWSAQLPALEALLSESPSFFKGGRVALDVGARALNCSEIKKARALLARHHVELWAVVSTEPVTEAAAQELGLVIELGPSAPLAEEAALQESKRLPGGQPPDEGIEGLVVRRTLRSGQSLRHPSHVVVIGDVNPGAEVAAGGNIVVWGRVRGVVHAGALGDDKAVICGLDLAPTQLRIAGHIARSPEEKRRKPAPEMASVREGRIVAVPWRGK
ncbi:MAG: septum site-determining protein MinC [Chloroflexi bacterium]|nr:MAG: septum site-determining protein MinC [Anaerolineaceae bacterium 4572_32.2]RLC78394.1 MAG: septum site-determining protein MinC [Chloroflexota bacterium]RLC84698.1 MAG: septum site-determining protein MinC [Chloroflexota bacterium]HEY73849.1 septum site-determining protein MinC [Thermoflexia bacterium]